MQKKSSAPRPADGGHDTAWFIKGLAVNREGVAGASVRHQRGGNRVEQGPVGEEGRVQGSGFRERGQRSGRGQTTQAGEERGL